MKSRLRELLRELMPPIVVRLAQRASRHGWHGDYPDWESARARSTGYDDEAILDRVTRGTVSVREGTAVYERDSVTFTDAEYRWPLLASLLWAAATNGGTLRIMDVGGSLGTTYLQHRPFLSRLPGIRWAIVEQPHFVARGRELFGDKSLAFFESLQECVAAAEPEFVLFGSSLQYFREPRSVLAEALACRPRFLVVDRTPFTEIGRDRLTIQSAPPEIYAASYPCWLFDRRSLLSELAGEYRTVAELPCDDRGNLADLTFRGFLFERARVSP